MAFAWVVSEPQAYFFTVTCVETRQVHMSQGKASFSGTGSSKLKKKLFLFQFATCYSLSVQVSILCIAVFRPCLRDCRIRKGSNSLFSLFAYTKAVCEMTVLERLFLSKRSLFSSVFTWRKARGGPPVQLHHLQSCQAA